MLHSPTSVYYEQLCSQVRSNDVYIQVSILLGKLLEYWKYWAGSFKVRGQSDGPVP